MKSNIIIVILTMTTILAVTYAYYEKIEAVKQEKLARENQILALTYQNRAEQQAQLAAEHAAKAMRQVQLGNEELEKCKKAR